MLNLQIVIYRKKGRTKLKYIIKMVNIALAMENEMENKEEAHENKI